jgi:uncharacterized protein (DUF362 family)
MSKISLTCGDDRYKNILNALNLQGDYLREIIRGNSKIVIKINFVHTDRGGLAVTHPEAVKAVLDFILQFNDSEITIAEAPFHKDFEHGLKKFGYYDVLRGYPVKFVDLNKDQVEKFVITELRLKPSLKKKYKVKIAKTILDSDFRIAVGPPKTHDTFVVTLGLKNLAVGSTIVKKFNGYHYRYMYHLGHYQGNLVLKEVCKLTFPHLNIIDGFQAMEGEGPNDGDLVDWKIAVLGTDALAVDSFVVKLMSFDIDNIGYLHYLKEEDFGETDINKIEILGEKDWQKFQKKFKLHSKYLHQIQWKR